LGVRGGARRWWEGRECGTLVLMSPVRSARAFTLIEAMIVVVMVGILALVAGVAYRKWVLNSHMSEAQDMVGNIRAAEETFRAENSGYLSVSSNLSTSSLYPSTSPKESFVTGWGLPCGVCTSPTAWLALNVQPSGAVMFGYAVMADNSGVAAPPAISVNGSATSLASMAGQPWYVVEAVCDLDNDATTPSTTVYGLSATNHLLLSNEGQ
jgi:prepilin-type N-terminal cleavage/methylation domain-containing protein